MRGGDVRKKNAIKVRGKAGSFLMARLVVAGQPARYIPGSVCPPEKMPMPRICQPELTDGWITQESACDEEVRCRVNFKYPTVVISEPKCFSWDSSELNLRDSPRFVFAKPLNL
jgi:hypothetical protein